MPGIAERLIRVTPGHAAGVECPLAAIGDAEAMQLEQPTKTPPTATALNADAIEFVSYPHRLRGEGCGKG